MIQNNPALIDAIRDRFASVPHDMLIDTPTTGWEIGARERIEADGRAIHAMRPT